VRLAREEVARLALPPRTAVRLVQRYGDDWRQAARMIGEDLTLGEPVADGLPVLGVEVALARSREMALTDEDIYVRRTRLTTLGLTPSAGSRRE
jgi:glycerol-3-phosphate dehydrogenase